MTLRTLNYGNYGIFLIMGNAEFPKMRGYLIPDSREDLESRSPNLGPYTTKGTL